MQFSKIFSLLGLGLNNNTTNNFILQQRYFFLNSPQKKKLLYLIRALNYKCLICI